MANADGTIAAVGGHGTVRVNSNGSWNNSGSLIIGQSGFGELHIESGGSVVSESAMLGQFAGSQSEVIVTSSGSIWTNHVDLIVGGGPMTAGGHASLTVSDNGLVDVGGQVKVWPSGAIVVESDGHLVADSIEVLGTLVANGSLDATVSVSGGGLVHGAGGLTSIVVGNGGTFSPGNSPGKAMSTSTQWNAGGNYEWEINRLADEGGVAGNSIGWDLWHTGQLSVGATAMNPFRIVLATLDEFGDPAAIIGWNPYESHEWPIAAADNAGGVFSESVLSRLTIDATQFGENNDLAGGYFALRAGGERAELLLEFTAVPEPSTFVMGLMAGVSVLVLKWRRGTARKPA